MESTSSSTIARSVTIVSAGASHTVALLSGGTVCSWGRGEDGQLGHGDAEERHIPTVVSMLEECEISSVTCGSDHTMAHSNSRSMVYSWGWGDFGRLGHGHSSDLFIPYSIKALQGMEIKQIACGDSHCLAVTNDGKVKSWGRNQNGQLGLGNTSDSLIPCTVPAFEGTAVKMVAAGAEHTVAVTESGKLYGWGWGQYGNLGLGDRMDRLTPEEVAPLPGEKMSLVACGWRHTIVTSQKGALYTYGWSKYGQLGHGDYKDHLVPHQVGGLRGTRIFKISGGWRHTMALDDQGRLFGWGWNKFGQIGVGAKDDYNTPQLVTMPASEVVMQVSCGWRHTVAMTMKHNMFSWGRGTSGQLGHGDAADRMFPNMVESLSQDGEACTQIKCPQSLNNEASVNWISPSERYAIVPDESMQLLAGCLHQAATVSAQMQHVPKDLMDVITVPDADFKRVRSD